MLMENGELGYKLALNKRSSVCKMQIILSLCFLLFSKWCLEVARVYGEFSLTDRCGSKNNYE